MTEQSNKQWEGLTANGELHHGVYYSGLRHKRFTLRIGMAGDLVAAQEQYPNGSIQLITLAVYHRQLLSLGDIPPEALTVELLREALSETDLGVIADADMDLEKKLAPPSAASPTGDASNMHLSEQATA